METWVEFGGHLHPLVLHLPIGILVLLVLLELGNLVSRGTGSSRLPDITEGTRAFIVFLFGVTAIFSAAFGLMLANGGGYNDTLLSNHRLFGLLSTVVALILFLVHRHALAYFFTLLVSVIVLVLAGHNGGSLTHGKGYLTSVFGSKDVRNEDANTVSVSSIEEVEVFAHVVQPILEKRCVTCHGDSKQKSELRLDTWDFIEKGGESGPVLAAGEASSSSLIERISLPEDHDDHMPPEGKPQLAYNEIRLLEWWVDAGASPSESLVELDAPEEILVVVARRLGLDPVEEEPLPERDWVLAEALRLERELGVLTQPLHPNEPWLEVIARLQFDAFGDAELAALTPLASVILRLDLGETAVTDAGMESLLEMQNLEVLKLDRTQISDAAMPTLGKLESLQSVSLFSTDVSDAGIGALSDLSKLKSVYLWQSQVTPDGAARLEERLSDERLVRRLRAEISQLESQISEEEAMVNIGESVAIVEKSQITTDPKE